ncbi:hypothetical protein IEQ34_021574 [Dendrobium chrysotoxum]|uniref:Uncharacterized protein n=1 Tax=Dendrobium chrysotoxum TaxID=161865 RepID=A0AAV7G3X2_DENCH|nr:hypothetical protein IEQ34_021574 [Dendrobium chrysotoxum]
MSSIGPAKGILEIAKFAVYVTIPVALTYAFVTDSGTLHKLMGFASSTPLVHSALLRLPNTRKSSRLHAPATAKVIRTCSKIEDHATELEDGECVECIGQITRSLMTAMNHQAEVHILTRDRTCNVLISRDNTSESLYAFVQRPYVVYPPEGPPPPSPEELREMAREMARIDDVPIAKANSVLRSEAALPFAGPPPETLLFAGPQLEALLFAGPPPEALHFAGPPPEALLSAGPPPEALHFTGPPPEVLLFAGPPSEALHFAGPPPEALHFTGPPPEALLFAGPPPEALHFAGPPPEALLFAGPPPEALLFAGPPLEALHSVGPPPEALHSAIPPPRARKSARSSDDPKVLPVQHRTFTIGLQLTFVI